MVLPTLRRLVIFEGRLVAQAVHVAERTVVGIQVLWLVLSACCRLASGQSSSPPPPPASQPALDGAHDFDWDIGTWTTHQRRLVHPLTGSTTWVEYRGTDVVRRLWDGANEGLVQADGPAGHLEIFTVRLYEPAARQWSIRFVNRATGEMSPPVVGEFKEARGEFYSHEDYAGRAILVRFSVSDITPTSCRFEQAFSADGGRTWEPNFVVTEMRVG
jgi:hypothetical protein